MKSIKLKMVLPKVFSGVMVFSIFFLATAFIASSLGVVNSTSAVGDTRDVNVNLGDILSLTVSPSSLEFDITPTPSGTFMKKSSNIMVTTNNLTGYTLSFSDKDDNTALNPISSSAITTTIPSITTASSNLDSINLNTWGYAFSNTGNSNAGSNVSTTLSSVFNPIPTLSSPTTLDTTNIPGDNTYNLTIGTNIDTTIPAGTYVDTLTITAVANYVPPQTTFFPETLTTMQGMTTEICSSVTTPANTATTVATTKAEYTDPNTQAPQVILTDTRDNKTYVVRKLADGRCWMTQNLRLGGSSAITLTPQNSNVTANFTLTASSDSFGTTSDAAGININRIHDNSNTWLDTTTTGSGSVKTTGTPPSQSQYMGNYYNWYTATAGTGTYEMSTEGQNATSSICPKGWRLPKGGAIDANTGNGEFQTLYDAYGTAASFISATSAVLSGEWSDTSAYYQGTYGRWWSSTVYNATIGYGLNFYISSVNPQYGNSKRLGFSVRCIAE